MAQPTLGFRFNAGDRVTPGGLHALIDEATISGFALSDFDFTTFRYATYGDTRATLANGCVHYDTTPGLEGLYFGVRSPSSASLSGWLCAMPRRECWIYAGAAVAKGAPLFPTIPHSVSANAARCWTNFDGLFLPIGYPYSGASGACEVMWLALEAGAANMPVKCMWAGLVPDSVPLVGLASSAVTNPAGAPLLVRPAASSFFDAATAPANQSFVFGTHTRPSPDGAGALIWSGVAALADYF